MAALLLVDDEVRQYEKIVAAAKSTTVVVVFDKITSTLDDIIEQVKALSPPNQVFTQVGLVQDGTDLMVYYQIVNSQTPCNLFNLETDGLGSWAPIIEFLKSLQTLTGLKRFDFISCLLDRNPAFDYATTQIGKDLGIIVAAAKDRLGNTAQGGTWLVDDGVNIADVYFTEEIVGYTGLLYNFIIMAGGGASYQMVTAANQYYAMVGGAGGQTVLNMTYAAAVAGSVYVWGYNEGGGSPTFGSGGSVTNLTTSVSNFTGIAATYAAFAALTSNGQIYVWGYPAYGGSPTYNIGGSVTNLGVSNFTAIAANQRAFAGLTANGQIYVWGQSGNGGSPTYGSGGSVTNLGVSNFTAIAATYAAFAAIQSVLPPPTITNVTPGTSQATVTFTLVTFTPAVTSYTISAYNTITLQTVTTTVTTSPATITGLADVLTNFTMTATNGSQTSAASAVVPATVIGVPSAPGVPSDLNGLSVGTVGLGTQQTTQNFGTSLRIDSQNNIYEFYKYYGASVVINGYGTLTSIYTTGANAIIVKRNPSSVIQWVTQICGPPKLDTQALEVDISGNVYVGGSFAPNASFQMTAKPATGTSLTLLASYTTNPTTVPYALKLSSAGAPLWFTDVIGNSGAASGNYAIYDIKLAPSGANPSLVFLIMFASASFTMYSFTNSATVYQTFSRSYPGNFLIKLNAASSDSITFAFCCVDTTVSSCLPCTQMALDNSNMFVYIYIPEMSATYYYTYSISSGVYVTYQQGRTISIIRIGFNGSASQYDGVAIATTWRQGAVSDSTNNYFSFINGNLYLYLRDIFNAATLEVYHYFTGYIHTFAPRINNNTILLKIVPFTSISYVLQTYTPGPQIYTANMIVDKSENVYIAGTFSGPINFLDSAGTTTNFNTTDFSTNVTGTDGYILKLNSNGVYQNQWRFKNMATSTNNFSTSFGFMGLAADSNNNLYANTNFYTSSTGVYSNTSNLRVYTTNYALINLTSSFVASAPNTIALNSSTALAFYNAPQYSNGSAITSYTLNLYNSCNLGLIVFTSTITDSRTSTLLGGLNNTSTYQYTVAASNVAGLSAYSAYSPVFGLPPTLNYINTVYSSQTAFVQFTPSNVAGVAYTGAVSSYALATISTMNSTIMYRNLVNGSNYSVSVTASNVYGFSVFSTIVNPIVASTSPVVPQNVSSVSYLNANVATISFFSPLYNGGVNISSYTFYAYLQGSSVPILSNTVNATTL